MNPTPLIATAILAFALTACGSADTSAPAEPSGTAPSMDHGDHDMPATNSSIGHGTGTIRSLGGEGDFLTIDHGPLEGIDMGAMTMGFDTMGDVDLSGFNDGDQVAFMVKQGRDGSFRIMAICNTETDGADCLAGMMDH